MRFAATLPVSWPIRRRTKSPERTWSLPSRTVVSAARWAWMMIAAGLLAPLALVLAVIVFLSSLAAWILTAPVFVAAWLAE